MAFPTLNAQQELNNRKILEDLQIKKQLLQKGVTPVTTSIQNQTNNTNLFVGLNQQYPSELALNTPARVAYNQATSLSLGFFVPQDSIFGNNILPVLPRFDQLK